LAAGFPAFFAQFFFGAHMNDGNGLGLLWIPAGFFLMLGSVVALFFTI
jgi:hypothetical protein